MQDYNSIRSRAYPDFPPCVALLLISAIRGEHLYHDERLFLASYMNAANFDPAGAIEPLVEHMPDYDPRKTHEQVAGIVAKGYTPAGCRRLKAANMCPGDCGRRHPSDKNTPYVAARAPRAARDQA
nr:hypothetical protein [Candidatus Sigynarchaeum springense]